VTEKFSEVFGSWIPVATFAFTVCSSLVLLGMVLGPQKAVPAQIDKLLLRVDSIDGRLSKIEWANESQKTQISLLGNQMSVESAEREKLAEALRDLKGIVDTIGAKYLPREAFLEWKYEYEAKEHLATPNPTRQR
jgi:hypothetical protein